MNTTVTTSETEADAKALAELKLPPGWCAWRGQITRLWWAAPPAWIHAPLISAPTLADLAELVAAKAGES